MGLNREDLHVGAGWPARWRSGRRARAGAAWVLRVDGMSSWPVSSTRRYGGREVLNRIGEELAVPTKTRTLSRVDRVTNRPISLTTPSVHPPLIMSPTLNGLSTIRKAAANSTAGRPRRPDGDAEGGSSAANEWSRCQHAEHGDEHEESSSGCWRSRRGSWQRLVDVPASSRAPARRGSGGPPASDDPHASAPISFHPSGNT